MFLGFSLLFVFILGLPISFLIGTAIAFIINKVHKRNRKNIWFGGIIYILSQPIALILDILLPVRAVGSQLGFAPPLEGLSLFEILFCISFAVFFTVLMYSFFNKYSTKLKSI